APFPMQAGERLAERAGGTAVGRAPRGAPLTPTGRFPTIRSMPALPQNQFTTVAEVYDNLMRVVPYRHWGDYAERLWERFGAQPRSVLDVACGTGNVLLELRRRGYQVAGVDNSAAMLAIARRKAGPAVPLSCQDMRCFSLDRAFDAAV